MKHNFTRSLTKIIVSLFLMTGIASAADGGGNKLDHVMMTLTAEEWVKTDTAKLTVEINAALDKETLAKMRTQIMENLNKIAKADWHLTDFDRSQDSSGLEKLLVIAEARVPENVLTNVNAQAKSISKPGAVYKIERIDFTPSHGDVEKVKTSVREDIYRQAQKEIETLNKLYPNQKYSLHSINFTGYMPYSVMRARVMMSGAGAQASNQAVVNTVSSLVTLSAVVDIASNRFDKQ